MAKTKKSKGKSAAKARPKAAQDTPKKEVAEPAKAAGAKDYSAKSVDKSAKSAAQKSSSAKKPATSKKAVTPKKAQKKPSIFRRVLNYFSNVRLEVKRTTWPTRNEVLNMTIIVIIALLFFGILIFLLDQIMVVVVEFISRFRIGGNPEAVDAISHVSSLPDFLLTGGK